MDEEKLMEIAKTTLDRVLVFFPRVDTICSIIVAIEIGMIAVLATNAPAIKSLNNFVAVLGIFTLLTIGLSFYNLFKCLFPKLEGGYTSLIYFREISQFSKEEYSKKFREQKKDDHIEDLIEQTWRNSEILTQKFTHLRLAFIFLLIAIAPWLITLYNFVSNNSDKLLK